MNQSNDNSVFNLGAATVGRLHDTISLYEEAMRVKDPNRMYDEAKVLYVELHAEMTGPELTTNKKLVGSINKSLNAYNLKFSNLQRVIERHPNKKILISLPNTPFHHIEEWFLHLKKVMKRLDLHLPKNYIDVPVE